MRRSASVDACWPDIWYRLYRLASYDCFGPESNEQLEDIRGEIQAVLGLQNPEETSED